MRWSCFDHWSLFLVLKSFSRDLFSKTHKINMECHMGLYTLGGSTGCNLDLSTFVILVFFSITTFMFGGIQRCNVTKWNLVGYDWHSSLNWHIEHIALCYNVFHGWSFIKPFVLLSIIIIEHFLSLFYVFFIYFVECPPFFICKLFLPPTILFVIISFLVTFCFRTNK
jgi:hypothetical protein